MTSDLYNREINNINDTVNDNKYQLEPYLYIYKYHLNRDEKYIKKSYVIISIT